MKTKLVSLSELTENNPTLCLSALRVFGDCHKCEQYKKFEKGIIKTLKCNPKFNKKALKLLRKRKIIRQNFIEANQELRAVNQELEKL